ncbi:MAG: ThuA domain-containing protein [Planctomycetes bacterium]|nr:ThuA domain-containing protein [Planctomycetota bacterium]
MRTVSRGSPAILAAVLALAPASVAQEQTPQPAAGSAVASPRVHAPLAFQGGVGAGVGKHVVLVAGDEEYRSEEALPQLARILATQHGFRCTVLFSIDPETGLIDPDRRDSIPGLAALATADLLVLFTRFRRLPDEDMRHVVDYVESGRPLIGIRTATHAFAYEANSQSPHARWSWDSQVWPGGFGRQVLGETWVSHHGKHGAESTRGVIPAAVKSHPVLRGVADVWGPTDVYGIRDLPPDATVILEGAILSGMQPEDPAVDDARNAPRMPIAWIRERARAPGPPQRVACSTIGSSQDLLSRDLRRLYVNLAYWCLGLEERIAAEPSAHVVGEFKPTPFGFGTFKRGVKPADLAL